MSYVRWDFSSATLSQRQFLKRQKILLYFFSCRSASRSKSRSPSRSPVPVQQRHSRSPSPRAPREASPDEKHNESDE